MSDVKEKSKDKQTYSEIKEISLSDIAHNDIQFRFRKDFPDYEIQKLARSMKEIGLQNPIKVRLKGDRYQLISGWERFKAAIYSGWETIRAEVFYNLSDHQAYLINSSENLHRSQLSDLELAELITRLHEVIDLTKNEIASWLGFGYQRVCDLYSITFMKQELQDALHNGHLKMYHIVELGKFPEKLQIEYMERAIAEGWSVKRIKDERGSLFHPFTHAYSDELRERMKGKFYALKFFRHPQVEPLFIREWQLIGKGFGIPGPFKCQCTSTIKALDQNAPFVCHSDIQYAIVAKGRIDPRGRDIANPSHDIQDWPAWAFLCQRCTAYMFPGVVYKDDIPFIIPLKNMSKLEEDVSEKPKRFRNFLNI